MSCLFNMRHPAFHGRCVETSTEASFGSMLRLPEKTKTRSERVLLFHLPCVTVLCRSLVRALLLLRILLPDKLGMSSLLIVALYGDTCRRMLT